MYKWKIDLILNSGKELTVYYKGTEINSGDVAKKILTGNPNDLTGYGNENDTKNIFVKLGEIAVATIYPA